MTTCYDLDRDGWTAALDGQPRYRVDQLWSGLYNDMVPLAEISTLPAAVRQRLGDDHPNALEPAAVSRSDDEQTTKYLWRLRDGHHIETVLMHYADRTTVCVSTQAGCAMACAFCATGQAGFDRHLSGGEIVEQVVRASRDSPTRVSGIVFMGMGEPLANYDNTWMAVHRLHDDVGISARKLTVSTVGLPAGIIRLADDDLPVNLAISLHAANDQLRGELVPIARRYALDELAEACRRYRRRSNRRLSFEWAMIDGVNDTDADAAELARFVRPLAGHVNLIPLNRTDGYAYQGSHPATIRRFVADLRDRGVNVTVRQNRGTEIDAACGQLRARATTTAPTAEGAGGAVPVAAPLSVRRR